MPQVVLDLFGGNQQSLGRAEIEVEVVPRIGEPLILENFCDIAIPAIEQLDWRYVVVYADQHWDSSKNRLIPRLIAQYMQAGMGLEERNVYGPIEGRFGRWPPFA